MAGNAQHSLAKSDRSDINTMPPSVFNSFATCLYRNASGRPKTYLTLTRSDLRLLFKPEVKLVLNLLLE